MFKIGLKKEGQEFIIMCKKSASFLKFMLVMVLTLLY